MSWPDVMVRGGTGGRTAEPHGRGRRVWIARVALAAILVGTGVVLVAGAGVDAEWARARLEPLQAFAEAHLVAALLAFGAVRLVFSVVSVPGSGVLTVAAGALFGFALGTLVTVAAAGLGALMVFLLARHALYGWAERRLAAWRPAIDRLTARHGASALLFLRLAEPFPTFLINVLFALTPMRAGTYLAVSVAGMLPGIAILANAGAQLEAVRAPGDLLDPVVVASRAAIGALPLLTGLLVRRLW